MFNLFDLGPDINQAIVKLPQWRYSRDGLIRNVEKILDFYRLNPTAVASDHFLVRLIQSISVPKSLNIERYYDNVSIIAPRLASMMNMTSSIYKGNLFDGIFYGRNSREVLISQSDEINLNLASVPYNWMNMTPVKVLTTSATSLGLDIPDGTGVVSDKLNLLEQMSFIQIDIPMLAVMYREFRRNEWAVALERGYEDSERSVMMFIRMYVLPNMLWSHVDQVIFNRAYGLLFGIPLDSVKNKHPFYLTDFSDKVDKALIDVIVKLQTNNRDFQGILKTIPAVYQENLYTAMALPDYVPTRQITWAMLVSRLKAFDFMFSILDEPAKEKNGWIINRLLREVRLIQGAKMIEVALPSNYMDDIDGVISVMARGLSPEP